MSIAVRGIPELKAGLQEINDFLTSPEPMAGFVADAKQVILEKTANGMDYQNRAFAPYSEKYAKKKTGMTATGRPNLKLSGTMLGSMLAQVINPKRGRISIGSVPEPGGKITSDLLANIHTTGTGKQPQREFMNLNDSQVGALRKKHWDDRLLELAKKLR